MKVLVTGIMGMLGSHIAEKCLVNGHEVFGMDDESTGFRSNVPEGATYSAHSVTDEFAVERIFKFQKPDAVIHCAAFAAEIYSHWCRAFTAENNTVGTERIISACICHKVKVAVFTSSIAVYGDQEPPYYEETEMRPCDPYGISKMASELSLHSAHRQFGLNHVIFRPHNVLGTRQSMSDRTRNVAGIFIRQALEGKPLTVFGDGTQTRAFSPVSQVASVIAASIDDEKCWNQTFNVGGETPLSVMELAQMILGLTGSNSPIAYLPSRQETMHAHSRHAKMRMYFPQFAETPSLVETLKEMIEEAKSSPMKKLKPLPKKECTEGCPEVWT